MPPPVPVPIARINDYALWQSAHPNDPLPGDWVNDDFDQDAAAVNLLQARLALIQRDDGGLVNGIVTIDSVDPAVPQQIADLVAADIDADRVATEAALAAALAAQAAAEAAAAVIPTLPGAPGAVVTVDLTGTLYGLHQALLKDAVSNWWQAQGLEIRNLTTGLAATSAVTLAQMNAAVAAAGGLPQPTAADQLLRATAAGPGNYNWYAFLSDWISDVQAFMHTFLKAANAPAARTAINAVDPAVTSNTALLGMTQGTAAVLAVAAGQTQWVVDCASGSGGVNEGVMLPPAVVGRHVVVSTYSGFNASVYPQVGEIINALAANSSQRITANKTHEYWCEVAGKWYSQDGVQFTSTLPLALGAANAGVQGTAARSDHVHPTTGLALTTRQVLAGVNLTGGGDLSADRTITHADSTVAPGTYTRSTITVDQRGHVTAAASGVAAAGPASYTRNCIVRNSTSAIIRLDADVVILEDAGGVQIRRTNLVNITMTITAPPTGAGGIDTGGFAGSTAYYLWLIDNGTTTALMASLSATAPTMPGGYTYKQLVGAFAYTGAALPATWGIDGRMLVPLGNNAMTALAAAVANTWEARSWAGSVIVPPAAAKYISGYMGTATVSVTDSMAIASDISGIGAQVMGGASSTPAILGSVQLAGAVPFNDLPIITPSTFYWIANNVTANRSVSISSYRLW